MSNKQTAPSKGSDIILASLRGWRTQAIKHHNEIKKIIAANQDVLDMMLRVKPPLSYEKAVEHESQASDIQKDLEEMDRYYSISIDNMNRNINEYKKQCRDNT